MIEIFVTVSIIIGTMASLTIALTLLLIVSGHTSLATYQCVPVVARCLTQSAKAMITRQINISGTMYTKKGSETMINGNNATTNSTNSKK